MNPTRPAPRRLLAGAVLVATALPIVLFYAWTASNGRPFGFDQPQNGYYNVMTRSLLAGRTDIDIDPDPRLFEMQSPYDPRATFSFRLFDASLYRGRHYLYWGMAPAVTLFAPWRLAGLGDLPERAAALIFASGAFVLGLLSLGRIAREHIPNAPLALRALAGVLLGLANVLPFVIRGAKVYEVAVSAGAFFLMGALYCALRASATADLAVRWLALSGLFGALAFASRPNHVAAIPLVIALALFSHQTALRRRLVGLAVAALPVIAVGLGVALFNHARFGSFTEFGTRYQLSDLHPLFYRFLDPASLGPGLYFFFLSPPVLRLEFPFIALQRGFAGELPPGYLPADFVAGLLVHTPILLVLFGTGAILSRAQDPVFCRRIRLLIALGLGHAVFTCIAVSAAIQRYEADFAGPLLVAALALWLWVSSRTSGLRRAGLVALFLVLGLATGLTSVAFSLRGFYDSLASENPDLWSRLERNFASGRHVVGPFLRDARTTVHLRVALTERPADELEPLLSSGTSEAQDVLFVRTVASGRQEFVLRQADGTLRSSDAISLGPLRFVDLRISLDRIHESVGLVVDDRAVRALPAKLLPLDPTRLIVGRGARGKGAPDLGRFSGLFITDDMGHAADDGLALLPPILPGPALVVPSKEALPARASAGALAIVAGDEGGRLFDGTRWRWLPFGSPARVRVERSLDPSAGQAVLFASFQGESRDEIAFAPLPAGRGQLVLRTAAGQRFAGDAWPASLASASPLVLEVDRVADRVTASLGGRVVLRAQAALLPLLPQQIALR